MSSFKSIMTTALDETKCSSVRAFETCRLELGWGFELFSRRQGDFAIVAVGIAARMDEGRPCLDLRLAVGGVSSTPVRFDDVTGHFLGQPPDEDLAGRPWRPSYKTACEIEETRIPAVIPQGARAGADAPGAASAALRRGRGRRCS